MVQVTHADRWDLFNLSLRRSVSHANWSTWLSRLDHDEAADELVLIAPSDFHLQWIRDKHEGAILEAASSAYGDSVTVRYRTDDSGLELPSAEPVVSFTDMTIPDAPEREPAALTSSRYRF